MITIRSRHHAAAVFRHLREGQDMPRTTLARRLYVSAKTIANREQGVTGLGTDALIDTAYALGFEVALMPITRPKLRPTGTGWPA